MILLDASYNRNHSLSGYRVKMSVDVKDIIYRIVQYLETTNYKAKLLKVCT